MVSLIRKADMKSVISNNRGCWELVLRAPIQCSSLDTWHQFVHLRTEVLRIKKENENASFSLPKKVLELGKEKGMLTNQALARKLVMNQQ